MEAIGIDILLIKSFLIECQFKKPNLTINEQSFSLKTVFFSIKLLFHIWHFSQLILCFLEK